MYIGDANDAELFNAKPRLFSEKNEPEPSRDSNQMSLSRDFR